MSGVRQTAPNHSVEFREVIYHARLMWQLLSGDKERTKEKDLPSDSGIVTRTRFPSCRIPQHPTIMEPLLMATNSLDHGVFQWKTSFRVKRIINIRCLRNGLRRVERHATDTTFPLIFRLCTGNFGLNLIPSWLCMCQRFVVGCRHFLC